MLLLGARLKTEECADSPPRKRLTRRTTGLYRSSFTDFGNDLSGFTPMQSTSTTTDDTKLLSTGSKYNLLSIRHHSWCGVLHKIVLRVKNTTRRKRIESIVKTQSSGEQDVINSLEKVLGESESRSALVDRLLAEHHAPAVTWTRFIVAVNEMKESRNVVERNTKSRKIYSLFVRARSRHQIKGVSLSLKRRPFFMKKRFTRYAYLVELKENVESEDRKSVV